MPSNPFRFLLDLSDTKAQEWLTRYLMDKATDPPMPVPSDIGHLEFLLAEVTPLADRSLPLRVGDLAGMLLAEAVTAADLATREPRFLQALFALVESLPLSDIIVAFLNRLAVTGQLLSWPGDHALDFHLSTLRSLVSHQRPVMGQLPRLIKFWKGEAQDLHYASISIQGLLRIAPLDALELIPDFIDRISRAREQIPVANLLFAVSIALGDDLTLWQHLVRVLLPKPKAFDTTKEGFRKIHLPRNNVAAWRLLEAPTVPKSEIGETSVLSIQDHEICYRPALGRAA